MVPFLGHPVDILFFDWLSDWEPGHPVCKNLL